VRGGLVQAPDGKARFMLHFNHFDAVGKFIPSESQSFSGRMHRYLALVHLQEMTMTPRRTASIERLSEVIAMVKVQIRGQ
jgi:hypothetical protein